MVHFHSHLIRQHNRLKVKLDIGWSSKQQAEGQTGHWLIINTTGWRSDWTLGDHRLFCKTTELQKQKLFSITVVRQHLVVLTFKCSMAWLLISQVTSPQCTTLYTPVLFYNHQRCQMPTSNLAKTPLLLQYVLSISRNFPKTVNHYWWTILMWAIF